MHEDVKTFDDSNTVTDWQENVNNGAQYTERRQKILDALPKLQEKWDGIQGGIYRAKTASNWLPRRYGLSTQGLIALD